MEGKNPEEKPVVPKGGEALPEKKTEPVAAEKPAPKKKSKETPGPRFLVSSSPHLHDGQTVSSIMKLVIYALIPASLFSVYLFGIDAARVILISVGSAAIFEAIARKMMKRVVCLGDFSAVLTGLLLALNLPSTSPWWLIVTGNFFAIVIAKQLYGGLGYNPFNPAIIGRVVLLISFPVHMTARWVTNSPWGIDGVTTATPLALAKESLATLGHIDIPFGTRQVVDLLIGFRPGSLGEVSVVLLLLGGLFLIFKKVITWHIPVSFIGTVWVVAAIFHLVDPEHFANPVFHVISGGLFLGAIFMATDYVTSPVTKKGMLIFGAGCGLITIIIRLFGAYPEGVSFSILLMNAATPLIDRWTRPTVFGAVKPEKAAAA